MYKYIYILLDVLVISMATGIFFSTQPVAYVSKSFNMEDYLEFPLLDTKVFQFAQDKDNLLRQVNC